MTGQSLQDIKRYLRDKQFQLALVAPVFVWTVMWFIGMGQHPFEWAAQHPGNLAMVVAVYPILEELAFRGLIQGYLRTKSFYNRSLYNISYANIATSAIFTLFHFFSHSPLWALSVFIPSVIFGYFRDRTGSVLPSIMLHAFYNTGYFLLFQKV